MTTTYHIALDKNGDGFVNVDAQPTDPPNLLPNPVTFDGLPLVFQGGTLLPSQREDFPYGTAYFDLQGGSASAGLYIGTNNFTSGTINTIPVTPGVTYTAVCWARGVTSFSGVTFLWRVYDQSKNLLASQNVALTADWAQQAVTFTPGAGVTHVCLALEKPITASGTRRWNVAGLMLVAAGSAPGSFNAGDDLNDWITTDVLEMEWRLGLAQAYDSAAAPLTGRLLLRNEDGRNSPGFPIQPGQTPLFPGRLIQIQATRDGVIYRLLQTTIERTEPAPGSYGPRTTTVTLSGPERELAATVVLSNLLVNIRADGVLRTVLSREGLGRYVQSFDTGKVTFSYVGDTWLDGVPAALPIRQVTEAEGGRFFTDRRGRLVFYHRDRVRSRVTPQATFDETAEAVDYAFGRDLVNQVRVRVRPRGVGAPGSTLWQLENPQLLRPGSANTRIFTVRMRDASDRPMGALAVITPIAGVDYVANTQPDGTGLDVTASLTVAVLAVEGSAVKLQLTSSASTNIYLLTGARLRGTPLYQADPMVVEQGDSRSITRHGLFAREYDLPYIDTIDSADARAKTELARRKNPGGAVSTLSLSDVSHPLPILERTLFDRITVKDAQLRHEADYFIIAEVHHIDLGGYRHRVTWTLEAANPANAWQLGRSALGQTTRLGVKY
ncbi:MAG: hypothetical protein SF029_15055 [bacterium]|nr:hypothetical protein [bacterium]